MILNFMKMDPLSSPGLQGSKVTIRDYFAHALPSMRSFANTLKDVVKPVPEKPSPEVVTNPKTSELSALVPETILSSIREASQKYGVSQDLIESVIRAESNFNPKAVSSVGAQGLMQLMPGTAKDMGVNRPFDIQQNIDGGVKYLRRMLDLFGQDTKLALAAYNAGPGNVKKYGGVPPYAETQKYVKKILNSIT